MRKPKKKAGDILSANLTPRAAFLLMDALQAQLKEDSEYIASATEQGRDDLVTLYTERQQIGTAILAECNRAVMP
jgi:hypothetical protein